MARNGSLSHADLRLVRQFELPIDLLKSAERFLRERGAHGVEGWVVMAGAPSPHDSAIFDVKEVHFPEQSASDIHTHVSGAEVERLADTLSARNYCIGIQMHTHPAGAFHSEVDDEEALVTKLGGLSVVIPDFARRQLSDISLWAVFRLTENGWVGPLKPSEVACVVVIRGGENDSSVARI